MNVFLDFKRMRCVVTVEPGERVYTRAREGAGESRLLHAIKTKLNDQGWNFIKKRMWKDGHMVDEMQQYLRQRPTRPDQRCLAIVNGDWAIQGADRILQDRRRVELFLTDLGSLTRDLWPEDGLTINTKWERVQEEAAA